MIEGISKENIILDENTYYQIQMDYPTTSEHNCSNNKLTLSRVIELTAETRYLIDLENYYNKRVKDNLYLSDLEKSPYNLTQVL